jgi:hypothetical protein
MSTVQKHIIRLSDTEVLVRKIPNDPGYVITEDTYDVNHLMKLPLSTVMAIFNGAAVGQELGSWLINKRFSLEVNGTFNSPVMKGPKITVAPKTHTHKILPVGVGITYSYSGVGPDKEATIFIKEPVDDESLNQLLTAFEEELPSIEADTPSPLKPRRIIEL